MNTNNISKEFVFGLFLKFFPQVINNLTGLNIRNLELEKRFYDRKIDAYTKTTDRQIFIENQLTRSDNTHLQQIEFIIENVTEKENISIIWTAESFDEDMINDVEDKIQESKKNIEFIAIKINNELIQTLDEFMFINQFNIIEKLDMLLLENKLEIVARYYRKYYQVQDFQKGNIEEKSLTEKQKIMIKILEEVRKQLHYFPNVHREKKMDGNVLTIGGGKSDVIFGVGVNRYYEIFIELRFNQGAREVFNILYREKDRIDDYFDYLLEWDTQLYKIYSSYPYTGENIDRIIKRQVRLLDRLVKNSSYFKEIINDYKIFEKCDI